MSFYHELYHIYICILYHVIWDDMGSYAVGGGDDDDDVAIINNEQDLFVSCFWALYWRAGGLVGW